MSRSILSILGLNVSILFCFFSTLVDGVSTLYREQPHHLSISKAYFCKPPPTSARTKYFSFHFSSFALCSLWGQRISNLCIFSICHSSIKWQRSGKEGERTETEEKRWMGSFDFRVLVNFPQLSFTQNAACAAIDRH